MAVQSNLRNTEGKACMGDFCFLFLNLDLSNRNISVAKFGVFLSEVSVIKNPVQIALIF